MGGSPFGWPVMWRDVFLTNRDAVRNGDGESLEALFTRTPAIRRSIIDAGQETAAADFGRAHEADKV
jgi:cyclohexadieny/prephenate dehydrogenase